MMVRTDDRITGGNDGGGSRAVGCIKATKGPWVVRRKTRYGGMATTLRFPSDEERVLNRERERRRRALTSRIFAGVRAHGNFPKQADSNDLLKALCDEAGWIVDGDGNVLGRRKSWGADLELAAAKEDEASELQQNEASETLRMEPLDDCDLTLSLSLPVRTASS